MIRKMSDAEHVCARPSMYIGSINNTKKCDYILDENKIQYREIEYVPGLIKIINEIIDNSVDVAIKNNFKDCNLINVKMTPKTVEVQDNGPGIPVEESNGIYFAELAWGHARAGSNFDDDENRTQIGMNGVGSFCTNCFSKKFIGRTSDGKLEQTLTFTDNAQKVKSNIKKTKKSGVNVKFWPDFTKFDINELDSIHMNIIKQRLINLSMSYPEITFKFNSRKINVNSFKKFVELFNQPFEHYETDDYKFAILANPEDDFKQYSYVNGLNISDGGTHVDIITNQIVSRLRERLQKKYKSIKPGDIRNKLMLVAFMKNMKNTKFNSQSKEKITNSIAEVNQYFGEIPYDKLALKIFKNSEIMDPITEIYRIKEEFKKRQELKGLKKSVKKIKSDKYFPSIAVKKYLLIVEGESALGGLMPVFGRKECGYFVLKGKPLNAYSATHKKFVNNKELAGDKNTPGLMQIIQNEEYECIAYATDQDLDGIHIRGLLTGFIERYLPEYKNKIGILQTPVIGIKKNNKLQRWLYSLNERVSMKAGEVSKYYKGLGSWEEKDLKFIVEKDGLQKMIELLEFDSPEMINDWLSDKKADKRKEYIQDNEFNVAQI